MSPPDILPPPAKVTSTPKRRRFPAPTPVLRSARVRARLVGPAVSVEFEQHYANDAQDDIEAVFTFPLPARAVMTGLEVELAGKSYLGCVQSRAKADAAYEEAIAAGDSAVKIERLQNGIYSAQVGNLRPGEQVIVRLRYSRWLEAATDGWRIAIPTVLAPMYGDAERDGGLPAHAVPSHSLLADYPLDFEFFAPAPWKVGQVRCTSMESQSEGIEGGVRVRLAAQARLDRDVVLHLEQAASSLQCVVPDVPGGDDAGWLCASLQRYEPGAVPTRPASLRIVLDCSGSMEGDSIAWAAVACQRVLRGLAEDDEFSITRFGSSTDDWKPRLVKATRKAIREAHDWLFDVRADLGGTEMLEAIRHCAGLPAEERAGDILLITDGQIWACDEILRSVRKAGLRVFVIGIGTSPNGAFLHELAQEAGGSCKFLSPGEDIVPLVDLISQRLHAGRDLRAQVSWPEASSFTAQWPRVAYAGEAVALISGSDRPIVTAPTIVGGEGEATPFVQSLQDAHDIRALQGLIGMERIRSGHFHDPEAAAVRYQLVTEWTSLVAVAVRAEDVKAGANPELVHVPGMVPAGWGGTGTLGAMPDLLFCASPAPLAKSSARVGRPSPSPAPFCSMRLDPPTILRRSDCREDDISFLDDLAQDPVRNAPADAQGIGSPLPKDPPFSALGPGALQSAKAHSAELADAALRLSRRLLAQRTGSVEALDLPELLRWARFPAGFVQALVSALGPQFDDPTRMDALSQALTTVTAAISGIDEEWPILFLPELRGQDDSVQGVIQDLVIRAYYAYLQHG